MLAAERHGVRWATLITQAIELTRPLPRVHAWVRAQLASLCGDGFGPLFSPYLVIAFTTLALPGGQSFPGHFALVGAALAERPGDFEPDLLDPTRRTVLITVGTLATGRTRSGGCATAA